MTNPLLTEEQQWLLLELGALSISEADDKSAVLVNQEHLVRFEQQALELGIIFSSREEVVDKNWVQECPELMQSIDIGPLTIVPLAQTEQHSAVTSQSTKNLEIFLRPGAGFGTGHHPATRIALELLLSSEVARTFHSALDLGTGSGILAIAAALLNEKGTIAAFDIDQAAIANAAENIALNSASSLPSPSATLRQTISDRITLSSAIPTAPLGGYQLILANIYSQVLIDYKPWLTNATSPGAELVISGILPEQFGAVKSVFSEHWEITTETTKDGWCGALLTRDHRK